MKKIIIMFLVALLTPQVIKAQGITYLTNLGQSSTGSNAVGSDSWLAASFQTGTNTGGYMLNSIQLAMVDASDNPSDFTAMLYSSIIISHSGLFPESSLGTLIGSTDPSTAGVYTYTPASLTLLPDTDYFIVLTAGTTVARGAYGWSIAIGNPVSSGFYNESGGWQAPLIIPSNDTIINYQSSNGSNWNLINSTPQFAINATPIPEPSTLGLSVVGGLLFVLHRREAKVV